MVSTSYCPKGSAVYIACNTENQGITVLEVLRVVSTLTGNKLVETAPEKPKAFTAAKPLIQARLYPELEPVQRTCSNS